jgi:hypothetical protein
MSKVLNRSRLSVTLLLAVAFTFSAACSKSENSSSTNSSTTSGPAEAVRSYYQAAIRKDAAGAKRYLSAGSISRMEAQSGKTFEVSQRESWERVEVVSIPNISNEKISGDTATVEVTGSGNGSSVTVPLVKEGGEWKMEPDKAIVNRGTTAGSPAATPTQTPAENN